jgi:hypothetical protein
MNREYLIRIFVLVLTYHDGAFISLICVKPVSRLSFKYIVYPSTCLIHIVDGESCDELKSEYSYSYIRDLHLCDHP